MKKSELRNIIKEELNNSNNLQLEQQPNRLVYKMNIPAIKSFLKKYPKVEKSMKPFIAINLRKAYVKWLNWEDKNEDYLGGRPETVVSPTFGTKTFYKYDWAGVSGWAEVFQYLTYKHFNSLDESLTDTFKFDKSGKLTHVKQLNKWSNKGKSINKDGVIYYRDEKIGGWVSKAGDVLTKKILAESINESSSYNLLNDIIDEISKVDGVDSASVSDVDSTNKADVTLFLKTKYEAFTPSGKMMYGAFDFDLRKAKGNINSILKKYGASIVQIYTPKKKYWKDTFGNSEGAYETNAVDMEIKLPISELTNESINEVNITSISNFNLESDAYIIMFDLLKNNSKFKKIVARSLMDYIGGNNPKNILMTLRGNLEKNVVTDKLIIVTAARLNKKTPRIAMNNDTAKMIKVINQFAGVLAAGLIFDFQENTIEIAKMTGDSNAIKMANDFVVNRGKSKLSTMIGNKLT